MPTDPTPILASLTDPHLSFCDVAEKHGITVDELAVIIARPDVAARLATIGSAATQRAVLLANLALPSAVQALRTSIETHNYTESNRLVPPTLLERMRQNCLRACNLLLRIARPPKPRPPKAEKPCNSDTDIGPRSDPGADHHDDNADDSNAPVHPDNPRDDEALPTPALNPSPPPEEHESAPESPAPVRPSPSDPGDTQPVDHPALSTPCDSLGIPRVAPPVNRSTTPRPP